MNYSTLRKATRDTLINIVFVRHAQCMHNAVEGNPTEIMPKCVNEATRASVVLLITRLDDDPLHVAHDKAAALAPWASGLQQCHVSSSLLPRPSPLHGPKDITALAEATKAALAPHLDSAVPAVRGWLARPAGGKRGQRAAQRSGRRAEARGG